MNIEFNRIRSSFYVTLFFLISLTASIFIDFPYRNIIMGAIGALLIILAVYQLAGTERIRRIFIKTSDILSESNERNFTALQEKRDNIINHKINNLIEQLQDSVNQTESVLLERDTLAAELVKSRETIEQMGAGFNRGIVELKEKVRHALAKMDGIISSIINVTESCGREKNTVQKMESIYGTYRNSFHALAGSIEKSREISEREILVGKALKEKLNLLNDRTENGEEQLHTIIRGISNIREVTDIINEVAEKASILSLNAAIESAHAGEAGKGFAVVAEEVGVLANTTAEHAEFINEALFSVTDLISDTRQSEETEGDNFGDLSTGLIEMTTGFEEILELLKVLKNLEKPEDLTLYEDSLKDKSKIENNAQALITLKEDLEIYLEELGRLALLKDAPPVREQDVFRKTSIHDTSLKTVRDEDLADQVD